MAEPRTWTITLPQPAPLMSMNDRLHWTEQRKRARAWRTASMVHAMDQLAGRSLPASTVAVALPVRDRRARDPHNYFATVKPIVDGLVDADIWPDDTPEYVTTIEPTLVPGATHVVITLTERTAT